MKTSTTQAQQGRSIMGTIALLGMPFVLSYTAVVYWVFRGKVGSSGYGD